MLLPLSISPAWMRVISHFNPLYYAVTAARVLSDGFILTADVATGFLVIGALTVITLT